jgi:hypothetical protein
MARGWESKSVESQIEEGRGRSSMGGAESREEIERRSRRESLESTRRGVERDLKSARTDAHRVALENALRFIDDELNKVR